MADEPNKGPKPFPSAKDGASDDDIFAEMGRMLAQDQLSPAKPASSATPPPGAPPGGTPAATAAPAATPAPAAPAAAKPASAPPSPPPAAAKPASAPTNDEPLELTQIIKPGKPQGPATTAPAAAPPASPAAAKPAQATTVGQAAAMLTPKPAPAPAAPAPAANAASVSNRSLDSIVEDGARGMIREWLDTNMERIAREEAAKAAAKVPPKT